MTTYLRRTEACVPYLLPFLFVIMSTACTLINKYMMTEMIQSSNLILFSQNVVLFIFFRMAKVILPRKSKWRTRCLIPSRDIFTAHYTTELTNALFYVFNILFGLWSVKYLPISSFGILKRLTTVITWVLDLLWLKSKNVLRVTPSIVIICIGMAVTIYSDVGFEKQKLGYILCILSCVMQGASFVYSKIVSNRHVEKHVQSEHDKASKFEVVLKTLYIQCYVNIIILGATVLLTGDYIEFLNLELRGFVYLFTNAILVFFLNALIFANCQMNSPITHAISGNFKISLTTLVGFVVFTERITPYGILGVFTTFLGTVHYSYISLKAHLDVTIG